MQQGPITQFEFNQFQQAARANPGDNKLQLLLAKKMVEAAAVLADEGGRADARTTRKNRENYIFDAHKIVKKLANSVRFLFFLNLIFNFFGRRGVYFCWWLTDILWRFSPRYLRWFLESPLS